MGCKNDIVNQWALEVETLVEHKNDHRVVWNQVLYGVFTCLESLRHNSNNNNGNNCHINRNNSCNSNKREEEEEEQ